MAVESVDQQSPPRGRNLSRVLKELQGLKFNVLTGAGAATPIALAAISTDDTIVAAFLAKDPAATGAALAPLTPSIPSNGNVQFVEATNASANDRVLVIWFDKQAL